MKEFWIAQRTIYPSIFRVLIGVLLLIDLVTTYPAVNLLFSHEFNTFLPYGSDFVSFVVEHYTVFCVFYGLGLILFILGIGKNISSLCVFIFNLTFLFFTHPILTWGDIILKYTLFYFIFVDSFRYFSFSKPRGQVRFLSTLAIWSIILHIFLIYLNNAFFKSIDRDWQNGYAVFYSFSQYSNFKSSIFYPILSNGTLSKWVGYLIILQQLIFVPFVIWKKTRIFIITISSIIHIIMMIQFGLWKFEIIILLHYGFLLTDEEWKKLLPKMFTKNIQ